MKRRPGSSPAQSTTSRPEVLTGDPATVGADVYSLGATIYALIAGNAAYERRSGEDLLAHYTRISSTRVPNLRSHGIPDAVCSAVEKAMAFDPAWAADVGGRIRPRVAGGSASQRLETRLDGHHCRRCRFRAPGKKKKKRQANPPERPNFATPQSRTGPANPQTRRAPPI